jgi:glycosyltransferase involved in cell wall biosynthesis
VVAVDLLETRRTAEDAAFYEPTGDPAEFAKALDELLRDEPMRAQMSRVGLARFKDMLSWEHQAIAYINEWRRLLRRRLAKVTVPAPRRQAEVSEKAKL